MSEARQFVRVNDATGVLWRPDPAPAPPLRPRAPAATGGGSSRPRSGERHPGGLWPLFPSPEDRGASHDGLTRELIAARARVEAKGVAPTLNIDALRADLEGFDFAKARPLDDTLAWTLAAMENGVTHATHPRYFGLFNPSPSHASELADRIASSFNPQLASATTSPAAVAIEAHVIRALARRAGLPDEAGGHFTSNGSEANFTALVAALTRAEPEFARAGARAFKGAPVVYASRDCHLAWVKIAHMAGIGRDAVRLVETDGDGRMDLHALLDALAVDRGAGAQPVMIVATAGTTAAGMIDPLASCADISRAFGCWLHVDAAWGGAALASERMRPLLDGIERADSITIDAHKWFATTMGCGMFLVRDPAALPAAFEVSNSFMTSRTASVDPYMNSVQWSRRFLGLRLFLSLASVGWEGYADHVERAARLAEMLREMMVRRGWWSPNRSGLAVVCLEPPGADHGVSPAQFGLPEARPDVGRIVRRVVDSGVAWVSAARFEGRDVVRACVTHGETTARDIRALADALCEAAAVG